MIKEVDAVTLKSWLDKGEAVLFDVREADEHAREHIAGANLTPLSRFDATRLANDNDKIMVFHCRSGNRTAQAAPQLLTCGSGEIYHLQGGIEAWKKAGFPVNFNAKQPISIMRQVQIVAGSLVVLGIVLAAFVSPWFALLSGFVGAGLAMSGITGTCLMATMLGALPYNRRTMTVQS
jgi:rhodanese-related sulfurtransferase